LCISDVSQQKRQKIVAGVSSALISSIHAADLSEPPRRREIETRDRRVHFFAAGVRAVPLASGRPYNEAGGGRFSIRLADVKQEIAAEVNMGACHTPDRESIGKSNYV
jgi:hypothetical protein